MYYTAPKATTQRLGALNAMPPTSYNDGVPDRYAHPHLGNHGVDQAQQTCRLPPPQSLAAGIPSGSEHYLPPSHIPQVCRPPQFYPTRLSPIGAQVSHLPTPLATPSLYPSATSGQTHQAHDALEVAEPLHNSNPVVNSNLRETNAQRHHRFPGNPDILAPQRSLLPHYRPHIETVMPFEDPNNTAPIFKATPKSQHEASMTAQSTSMQPQRAETVSLATRIPNLLGDSRSHALVGISFALRMRQQPNAARACGFGDRDRRVIDPPPIVQLVVEGPNMSREDVRSYLRYESYVMSCSIYDESGTRDSSYMPEEYQHQRRLMGSLVSTPFAGKDENGEEGCFFCFSDLSCRTPGSFRLKFTLMMIDPSRAGPVRHFPILADIKSEPFKVYSAKEFPGMVASSELAKRLKEQGCIISIKKGNDRGKNARSQGDLSDDNDEQPEGSQGQRKRRTIRG